MAEDAAIKKGTTEDPLFQLVIIIAPLLCILGMALAIRGRLFEAATVAGGGIFGILVVIIPTLGGAR